MVQLKKYVFFLSVLVLVIAMNLGNLSAEPPQETANGLQINTGINDYLPLNEDLEVHMQVSVIADGLRTETAECELDLHDNSGVLIFHRENITHNGHSYAVNVSKGNFTEKRTLRVLAYCNASTVGGTKSFDIYVAEDAQELTTGKSLMSITLLFLLIGLTVLMIIYTFSNQGKNYVDSSGQVFKINYRKYLQFLTGGLSYVNILFILAIISSLSRQYLDTGVSTLLDMFYLLWLYGLYIIAILLPVFIIINLINDKKMHDKILRWNPTR